MRIAKHGEEGASHAVTYYAVVETVGAEARLAVAQAGDRPHPPVARPHGRIIGHPIVGDREIFPHRELGVARRHAEQAASAGAAHRGAASARRRASTSPRRCRRTCSRPGICSASTPSATTRSSRRRKNESAALTIWVRQRLADIQGARPRVVPPPGPQDRRACPHRRRPDGAAPRRHDDGGVRGEAPARRRGLQDPARAAPRHAAARSATRTACIWNSASTRATRSTISPSLRRT